MAAKRVQGKVGYRDLVVGAGLAFDKSTRIAYRRQAQARQAAEQAPDEDPDARIHAAITALTDDQQRLLVLHIHLAGERRAEDAMPDFERLTPEEGDRRLLEHIGWYAALTPEQTGAELV